MIYKAVEVIWIFSADGTGRESKVLSVVLADLKINQKYPNMLLTLTWCHRTPADTPTRICTTGRSAEHQLDDVACACYVGRQGGAAALLHQGCPVPVRDCQVVVGTGGMGLNVKCSEL